jgi:hypothetical protein
MTTPPDDPDSLGLTPQAIAMLRSRHVAFLAERMVDERARGDFIRSFEGGYDHVLDQPLRVVVDPKAAVTFVSNVLTSSTVRGLLSPIVREINRRVIASLRTDDSKLGTYVPKDARDAIDSLLARPDLVPEELVRKIFDDDVTEELMRDVLYDALVEFNQSVNPFFADWGLTALIKRFVPIGSGAVLKSMSAVRGEFDKRLDPEIRKFLLGFSRRSKHKLADFILSKGGDPKLVALRQSVVAFFYDQTLADLMKNIDDDARIDGDEATEAIVRAALESPVARKRLEAGLEKLLADHGDEKLGAWLARIGVTQRPPLAELAEALWPFVRMALESPPARAFYERVTWDFYATLASQPSAENPTDPEDVP